MLAIHRQCLLALLLSTSVSSLMAQNNVDIYFIAGQSNAGNLGEINSYDVQGYNGYNAADFNNQTDAGFNLTFGRIRDRSDALSDGTPRVGGPVTEVVEQFSESNLDATNYAVDNIAVQLNAAFGKDIGIFSYGRNGKSLYNQPSTGDGGDWFPGTVATPYNSELYGSFLNWSSDRITEVENGSDGVAGTSDDQVAVIQGVLWFQGETDSESADGRSEYEANFGNLVSRFREDFNNPNLAVVASQIRGLNGNDTTINNALNAVALNDPNVDVIDISDANTYIPVSANDVHLSAAGFMAISNDYAERLIQIQTTNAVPEPGSALLLAAGAAILGYRRRRSAAP